jgi:hypothetical protein
MKGFTSKEWYTKLGQMYSCFKCHSLNLAVSIKSKMSLKALVDSYIIAQFLISGMDVRIATGQKLTIYWSVVPFIRE